MISTWRLYENGRDIYFGLSSERPASGDKGDTFYAMDTGDWKTWTGSEWEDFIRPTSGGGSSSAFVGSAIVGTAIAG